MPKVSQFIHALMQFDHAIQYLGIALSVIGVGCTIYAIAEFLRSMHHLNGLQRLVALGHVVGQGAILVVQACLLLINVLVITLPDVPLAMYAAVVNGPWVMFVIVMRKVLRLLIISILAASSIYRVWSFHRLMAYMHAQALHHHRRASDPVS